MPAPRRKRLPTDFFDRLLSNQTDDQMNDLIGSLMDEQIAPTVEKPAEEAAAPLGAAKKRSREFHRDKIEDAIVTRDESLDEEVTSPEAGPDELIPRTRRMGAVPVEPPRPSARPSFEVPPIPEPPHPPSRPGIPEFTLPPELLKDIPSVTEAAPTVDLTQPDAGVSRIVSQPPSGVHGAPVRPARPEPTPAAPPRTPAPAEIPVSAPPLKHEELVRARRQARWHTSQRRRPKAPKLAPASAPVSFKPPKLLDRFLDGYTQKKIKITVGRASRAALVFLLPAFLAFSLFSWYPMFKGLTLSFLHFSPTGASTFAGLDNYVRAFHDPMFWSTLGHAGIFCALVLAVGFWVPILLTIFINELRWGKGMLKFLFFLPFLMPTVPASILWKWILDQGFGLANAVLNLVGVADPHVGWLTDPKLAIISIALLYIWKNTGWAILIYSAALTHVDETLYEESEIDGATLWDKIWHVTLPSMRGVISVMFLITLINTLQIFTEVYILTNGGPMQSTEMIATYLYKQAFFYMDIGYATALSMILLLLLLFVTVLRLRRLEPEGE